MVSNISIPVDQEISQVVQADAEKCHQASQIWFPEWLLRLYVCLALFDVSGSFSLKLGLRKD